MQGRLVNGSAGKVVDFITTHQAWQRKIEIARLVSKEDKSDNNSEPASENGVVEEALSGKHSGSSKNVAINGFIPMDDVVFDKNQLWPLVRFTNGMTLLCAPLDFTVEGLTGSTEVLRLQVPLILSWALSIHKSQGQTLERVRVDLNRIFEKGQGSFTSSDCLVWLANPSLAYVALSRATTIQSLEIQNFHPSK
jgi:ATP-dependent DNA helicase PIF1